MATKTINLTGAEVAVTGLDGAHAHIRNDGTEVIYVAKTAGITTGADGVLSIPAGQAATVYGISGTVYMLGTGSAQIISNDYSELPFKTSATSGGSGADEVARAAISSHAGNAEIHVTAAEKASWNGKAELSDIPTTLPANGGNAETVGGKSLSQIMTSNGLFTGDLDTLKVQCSVLAMDCTNAPENAAYWGTVCVYIGGTGSVVQIFAETTLNPNELTKVFIRHFTGHFWSPWKNIADCGNATTLETHPASDFVLKTEYEALAARVAALEGGTT